MIRWSICASRLDLRQLLEDCIQLLDSRLRASDVADGNRNLLTGVDGLSQRRAFVGRAYGLEQRCPHVRYGRSSHRLDDRHPFVGEIDLESIASVVESYSHFAGECTI